MTAKLSTTRHAVAFVLLVTTLCGAGLAVAADTPSRKEITYPSFIGRVLQVTASDALQVVLVDGRRVNVGLAGLQGPAEGEHYAESSRRWLQSQLAGQIVSIDCDSRTVDGPLLRCVVYPDDRDINYLALRSGMARTLEADLKSAELADVLDAERYQDAESIARGARLGVWAVSTVSAVSP